MLLLLMCRFAILLQGDVMANKKEIIGIKFGRLIALNEVSKGTS